MTGGQPVLIMAGGTGGHVYPALAVARWLRDAGVPVVWLGGQRGLEQRVVAAAGLPLEQIAARPWRGQGIAARLALPGALLGALWQALRLLRRHRPRAVLGMGGYAAGPGGLAAWLLRLPLYLHEQNAVPGLSNRLLAPLARAVFTGFPGVFAGHRDARYIGNPLRAEFVQAARLTPARQPTRSGRAVRLAVIGGSQGAHFLNQCLPRAVAAAAGSWEIRHQCGDQVAQVTAAYGELGLQAEVMPFCEEMAQWLNWADLVVARAGAMTCAELCALGVPSLLIPLPTAADDHQTANARFLAEGGAAVLLPQAEAEQRLSVCLADLARDATGRARMAQAARGLARLDATEQLGRALLQGDSVSAGRRTHA